MESFIVGRKRENRRVLVVNLHFRAVNEIGQDPIDEPGSRRLKLTIERVREEISFSYTKDLAYGAVCEEDRGGRVVTIYFPSIVIDDDAIYQVLVNNLARSLNDARLFGDPRERFGEIKWNYENITLEKDPCAVEAFEPELCSKDCYGITEQHIMAQQRVTTTYHTIALSVDRFSMLLEYYTLIHETDKMFFRKNIRYIAGAYHRQRKHTTYAFRERDHVTCEDWLGITRKFDVEDTIATTYYREVEDFAYTTVTMEEVLKRYSTDIADKLGRHNDNKIRHMIKLLILQRSTPSSDQLWEVFSEFIRCDHFYADKEIWVLDECRCVKKGANELRPVIKRFTNYIREGKVTIQLEEHKEPKSLSELEDRIRDMVKPFENNSSCKFVENACANYLYTSMKSAIKRVAIAFRDVVLIYDKDLKTLDQRKAYMEDQFTTTTAACVNGYGHLDFHKRAIHEVKEALVKMFHHPNNVHWFIKWMGSLLAHLPERTCLIMYGPRGGNAKSTIATVLIDIFGESATQCRPDILITNKNGGQTCTPFEADLMDRVLAVISEPQRTQVYSSATLKDMTGGDKKTAAKKYKDPVTFDQTAKPVILSNHMIQFDEIDEPLCDRLFITHCYGRFTSDANRDPEIQKRDHHYPADQSFWNSERKQALAHIIIHEGFRDYAKEGLKKTPEQIAELNKWRCKESAFAQFAEHCEMGHDGKTYLTDAHCVYAVFKEKNPKRYDTLTYNDFLVQFRKDAHKEVISYRGTDYFELYHRNCMEREPID